MKQIKFTKNTFAYFDQAHKNKNNPNWFNKNSELYKTEVHDPFTQLILQIDKAIGPHLPKIDIPKKHPSRPLRAKNRAAHEGGLIKDFSHFTLWEKRTSLFEWNPGIHFQLGHKKDDNFIGVGLYMVSSRQLSLLRHHLFTDFDTIHDILKQRSLKKSWGSIQGETYKRFPKGFDPEDSRSRYLWHKQFYLSKNYSRTEVLKKDFQNQLIKDLKIAMPFFSWVRQAVGTYER